MGQSTPSPNSAPGVEQDYDPPEAGIDNPDSAYQQSLTQSTGPDSFDDPEDYPGFDHLEDGDFSRENGPPPADDDEVTGWGRPSSVESPENRWVYDEHDQLTTAQKARVAERKSNGGQQGHDTVGRPYRASDPNYSPEETSGDTEQQTFKDAVNLGDGMGAEELLEETQGQAVVAENPQVARENASQSRRIATEVDDGALNADPQIGEAGSYDAVGGMDPTGDSAVNFSETVASGPAGSQTIPGSHLQNRSQIQADLERKGFSETEATALADYVSDLDYINTPEGQQPRGAGMDLQTQERIEGEATELFENTQRMKDARKTILKNTDVSPDKATDLVGELHQRRRNRSTVRTEIEAEGQDRVPGRTSADRDRSTTPPSQEGSYLFSRSESVSDASIDYRSSLVEANRTIGQLPEAIVDDYLDTPTRAYWENGDVSLTKVEQTWVNNLKRNIPPDLVNNADPTDPTRGMSFTTDEWNQSDLDRFKQSLEKAKAATVTDVISETETVRPETVDAVEPYSRHNIKGTVKHVQTKGIKDFRQAVTTAYEEPNQDEATGETKTLKERIQEIKGTETIQDRDDGAGIEQLVYLENQQGDDLKVAITASTESPHPDVESQGPYHHSDHVPLIREGDTLTIEEANLYHYKVGERSATEGSIFDSGGWNYSVLTDRQSSVDVE